MFLRECRVDWVGESLMRDRGDGGVERSSEPGWRPRSRRMRRWERQAGVWVLVRTSLEVAVVHLLFRVTWLVSHAVEKSERTGVLAVEVLSPRIE